MSIWITGASGYIGGRLRARLAGAGEQVVGLDIAPPASGSTDRFVVGPVGQDTLSAALSQAGVPSAVFHLAGGAAVGPSFADPAADFRNSVVSSSLILEFVRTRAPSAVVVLTSSAAVYGNSHSGPVGEAEALMPVSPYGAHKQMVELLGASYGRDFGIDVRVVRPFSVYGAGLRKQLFWDLCRKLRENGGVTLSGTGRERRDFVHGDDVALALDLVARAPRGAPRAATNIGAGEAVSIERATALLAAAWTGATGRQVSIGFSGDVRPGDPACLAADCRRLNALGFRPAVALDAGLGEYVTWFLAAGGG